MAFDNSEVLGRRGTLLSRYASLGAETPSIRADMLAELVTISNERESGYNAVLWSPVLCFLAMALCFLFSVSIGAGFLMQVSFVWLRILAGENFQFNALTAVIYLKLFLCLPGIIVSSALWLHEHWLLLLSLFDRSHLATYRSVFFATFANTRFKHNWLFEAWFSIGLVGFSVAGVAVVLIYVFGFTALRISSTSMLGAYLIAGLFSGATLWSLVTVFVHICCKLHINTCGRDKREAEGNLRSMFRFLGDPTAAMLDPNECFRQSFNKFDNFESTPSRRIGGKLSHVLVALLAANILTLGIAANVPGDGLQRASMLCVVNLTIIGGLIARCIMPSVGVVFWSVIVIFLIVMVSMFVGSTYSDTHFVPAFGTVGVKPLQSTYCLNTPISPYPVCSMRWGVLSIIDLAILAQYSFAVDAKHHENLVRQSFDNAPGLRHTWTMFNVTNSALPMITASRFVAAVDNRIGSDSVAEVAEGRGTVVIAVKGTTSLDDVLFLTSLFAEIAVLQWASFSFSLLDILPNTMFAWLLDKLRLADVALFEASVLHNLSQAIKELQDNTSLANDSFVIVGHSLGGSIAQAVGSQMRVPTVVFSTPGAHFTRWSMNTTMEGVYRNVVSIKPDYDDITDLDRQDAMVQKIECRKSNGARKSFPVCNRISTTICELERACGDPRGRDFLEVCADRTGTSTTGCYLEPLGDT
eukprot:TRINITY_DN12692_c0_g1_i1.p1 TRINITY_DN12692_c0_g1~~TRINITY_DN12692_c0_g1_i1.p1  ORF type:complete len:696 (-),score=59.33 TRINITY_DN12692_c0_g1_i1:308-2395(-)